MSNDRPLFVAHRDDLGYLLVFPDGRIARNVSWKTCEEIAQKANARLAVGLVTQ